MQADMTTEPVVEMATTTSPPGLPSLSRARILGMEIDPVTLSSATERCARAISTRKTLVVGVLNVAKLVQVQEDRPLRDAVAHCDLVIADGMPLVWASRLLGQPLPERVPGIDLFLALIREADREGWSIYLLGATQEVLDKVVERIRREYPSARIAGARNGYFSEEEAPAIAEGIRASGADLLFIGISTPKKEFFLDRWARTLGVPVCHGVGGSFDVFAGLVERAPERWQRLGLEWLYRVRQEPRRLWKRYLTTNTRFVLLLIRELMRGRQRS